jgi:anti-sigma factor RsiW
MIDHLNEQILNMYLDAELSTDERKRVDTHLAACDACRTEMQALQGLFTALEELASAPEPTPNLLPGVLAHIDSRRRAVGLRRLSALWLIPALQGAAALALLAWGWTRLADYWALARQFLPLDALRDTQAVLSAQVTVHWATLSGWVMAQWAVLIAWPGTVWDSLQEWAAWMSTFGNSRLSLAQLAVLGASLAAFWLASNAVLLSRAFLNGQVGHKEALK